jgi:hypothetical protein
MSASPMREQMSSHYRKLLGLLFTAALGAVTMVGCGGDDPVAPPPDLGSSSVTFLHVNPGRDAAVAFFRADTIQIGSGATATPQYAGFFKATVPNGTNLKYTAKATSGQVLASGTGSHDSSKIATVVYAGDALLHEIFVASTTRIEPGAGNVAIRFIHAAKDAGARILKANSANGTTISTQSYKGASGSYVTIPATTTSIWIVDTATTNPKAPIEVQIGDLSAATSWSVVFFGTENPVQPSLAWTGQLIADE